MHPPIGFRVSGVAGNLGAETPKQPGIRFSGRAVALTSTMVYRV